jgi:hypothetical protein
MQSVQAPLTAALGAPQLDDSTPEKPVFIPLLMEERDRLKAIFKDPAFVKAWRNLRCSKPGVFNGSADKLAGPMGLQLKSDRFHEIRGWELLVAALLIQAEEPVVKTKAHLQEYPDAGTIEAEMERTGGPVEQRKVPGQAGPVKAVPVKGPMPTPKIANTSKIRKP